MRFNNNLYKKSLPLTNELLKVYNLKPVHILGAFSQLQQFLTIFFLNTPAFVHCCLLNSYLGFYAQVRSFPAPNKISNLIVCFFHRHAPNIRQKKHLLSDIRAQFSCFSCLSIKKSIQMRR